MSNSVVTIAQSQYYARPKDERFATAADYLTAAQHDKHYSLERKYNLRDLQVVPVQTVSDVTRPPQPSDFELRLQSAKGSARFTSWSLDQLCRSVKAPSAYVRALDPAIASLALNDSLHRIAPHGQNLSLLIKANGTTPIVRAATSEKYGRAWDVNLAQTLEQRFPNGAKSPTGGSWQSPPTWTGEQIYGYRGDRDSFILRIDGGSIVQDPSVRGGDGAMYRGIMMRNSEVGACSVWIDEFLFRGICGNHLIWGFVMDSKYRRRHVGEYVERDSIEEILRLSSKFAARSASSDEHLIRALIDREIATTKDGVIDTLMGWGMTKDDASEAYSTCEQHEHASPRSFWGIVQGMTRNSQESGFQNERQELDRMASTVLSRGRVLVAAS